jgi:hypothetical protein
MKYIALGIDRHLRLEILPGGYGLYLKGKHKEARSGTDEYGRFAAGRLYFKWIRSSPRHP